MGIFKKSNQTGDGSSQVESHDVGHKFSVGRKQLALFIALAVLVATAIGWLVFTQNNKAQKIKNDPVAAIEENLKQELKSANTPEAKADVYIKLSNETSTTSITKSVSYAKKAVETTGTVATYAQLAFTLEQSGDTKQAAAAYRKAAELSPKPSNPDENTDYTYYLGRAKNLEASQ